MTPAERDRLYKAIRNRLERGETIRSFADRIGVSRSIIQSWVTESPRWGSDPRWESLRLVAKGLNIKMWELVKEIELERWEKSDR